MKRTLCLILSILLLIAFGGCNKQHENFKVPVQFYYKSATISYNSEDSVIRSETREGNGYDLVRLLNKYLQGPITDECLSPFPTGVTVLSIEPIENKTLISISAPFAKLEGIALTLACTCLAKTVMELTETTSVEISVPNASLNGSASITIDAQNVLLLDSIL